MQAADSGYQAPVSTGNLYYYYYPVAAYPINEKADEDELDPLVLVLLPVALLVGFLALVSIFSKLITKLSSSVINCNYFQMSPLTAKQDLSAPGTDRMRCLDHGTCCRLDRKILFS